MHKYIWVPGIWVIWHKFKALFMKKPYSMYEHKIVRDYRDGKVSKESLDKCSTCEGCGADDFFSVKRLQGKHIHNSCGDTLCGKEIRRNQ